VNSRFVCELKMGMHDVVKLTVSHSASMYILVLGFRIHLDARGLCAQRVAKQAELKSMGTAAPTWLLANSLRTRTMSPPTQQTSFDLGSKNSVLLSQTVRCEMSASGIYFDKLLGTKPVCFQGASQRLTNGEECLEGNFDHAGNHLDYEPRCSRRAGL